MKRLLLNIVLLAVAVSAYCSGDTLLMLQLRNGSKVSYIVSEKLKVEFKGGKMVLTSSQLETAYDIPAVLKYSFLSDANIEDGVEQVTAQSDIKIKYVSDDVVEITGIAPAQRVRVYTTNGIEQSPDICRTDSTATIMLGNMPAGVLLITVSNTDIPAFKVVH